LLQSSAAAYIAGRWSIKPQPPTEVVDTAKVRERILVVAVGDHLSKSEMFLIELSNAQPNSTAGKLVNISAQQHRAEDLLEKTASTGRTALQGRGSNDGQAHSMNSNASFSMSPTVRMKSLRRASTQCKKSRVARNFVQSFG